MRWAVFLAVFFAAYTTPPRQVEEKTKPTTIKSSSGQILCAIHHIPLTTIHGWGSAVIALGHPIGEASIKYEECNPNQIPYGVSRRRTKECTIPTEITYCKWCDEGVGCDF
jgi:hypothetical protein